MEVVFATLVGGSGLGGVPLVESGVLTQLFEAGGVPTVLAYVLSALAALGALIFIHELGHFLVAKAMGVGVERFSLGFGPRLWAHQRGETEYCVSVIPLGGYVKMVGEEAFGEELVHPGAAPAASLAKSFSLKPLGARALIVFAGPGMNFVLAIAIYAIIFVAVGVGPVLLPIVGRVPPGSPAAEAGLQLGDTVLAVDARAIRHWGEVEEHVQGSDGQGLALTIGRDGERRELSLMPRRVPGQTPFGEPTTVWSIGVGPYLPPVVGEVLPGRPAAEAGLRPGDRIVGLDGEPVEVWDQLVDTISQKAGQPVTLTIERAGERLDISVTPRSETQQDPLGEETQVGRIGIASAAGQTFLRSDPFSAVWQGVERTFDITVLTVVSLWKVVTGSVSARHIGGPLQIGVIAGQAAQQGVLPYVMLVAVISINLGVINLFPVPILDGGHLLFFAIEGALGRPLSVRKREIAQQIGLGLVMLLIVLVMYNDIARLWQ